MSAKELFAALLSTDNNIRSEAEVRICLIFYSAKKIRQNEVRIIRHAYVSSLFRVFFFGFLKCDEIAME